MVRFGTSRNTVQKYNKYLNCANFLAIIFQKKFKSFPKQKVISLIINDLRFLSTQKVVQNEKC